MIAAMSDHRSGVRFNKKRKNHSETNQNFDLDQDSGFSSLTSSDESNKPDESIAVLCQACRLLELKSLELKKQREDLKRSLLLHLRQHHAKKKPRTSQAVKNEIGQESNQGDAPIIVKDQSHNLRSVSERSLYKNVPIFNKQIRLPQPPEPKKKRLKGELAKSIGRRIEGCNLNILDPNSEDSLS